MQREAGSNFFSSNAYTTATITPPSVSFVFIKMNHSFHNSSPALFFFSGGGRRRFCNVKEVELIIVIL